MKWPYSEAKTEKKCAKDYQRFKSDLVCANTMNFYAPLKRLACSLITGDHSDKFLLVNLDWLSIYGNYVAVSKCAKNLH